MMRCILLTFIFIVLVGGCSATLPQPLNMVVLVDCSSSLISDDELRIKNIAATGEYWVNKVTTTHRAGRFEILLINSSIFDVVPFFEYQAPGAFPKNKFKKAWKEKFLSELHTQLKKLPINLNSGIIEGMFFASECLSNFTSPRLLIIHSDLRYIAKGKWNFEKSVPCFEVFKKYLDKMNLHPNFSPDTGVLVVGFKPYQANADTSPVTSAEYRRLLELWNKLWHLWLNKDVKITEEVTGQLLDNLLPVQKQPLDYLKQFFKNKRGR